MPSAIETDPRDRVGIIRHALRSRGTSVNGWAKTRGYRARTVYDVLRTWAHRTDRAPLGGQARRIMADLRADLGPAIVPPITTAPETPHG